MVRRSRLGNGIRVLTQELEGATSVAFGLWVENGSRFERADENGLSHFLEHLIFKGTEQRSAFEIAAEVEAVGGDLNAFTTKETTCYHARVLAEHTDLAFDVLADIFTRSRFDATELERERGVILQEIAETQDDPEDLLFDLVDEVQWGEHPLARPIAGTPETVQKFRRDDVVEFFRARYRPDRTLFVASGALGHDLLVERCEAAFGSLAGTTDLADATPTEMHRGVHVFRRSFEQVHFCLGMPGLGLTDPDRFAVRLLDTALGGGMSSRLFQEIRERRGQAYSVYSFTSSYRDCGMFGVYAATAAGQFEECVRATIGELERVAASGLTSEELERTRSQVKGNLLLGLETTEDHMNRIAYDEIYFRADRPLAEVLEAIDRVTPEDVARVAARILDPTARTLVVVGDLPKRRSYDHLLAA